ncbi:MAG TPA: outer membrane beta-barrel protein [Vicinamibacteria bacterium]
MRGSVRAVLFCSMLSIASLGRAQERGHAAFVLGWTFGEETASLYGAQFGASLGGGFSIVGGVESLKDTLTGRYALFLNQIANVPGVSVSAKVPGLYYGAGLRWTYRGGGVSPFAQVELGGTKVTPEVAFTVNGQDVTDQILAPGELDETAFTFSVGGGLRGNLNDTLFVEAVFKFFDILTEQELSLNRLSIAVGARF